MAKKTGKIRATGTKKTGRLPATIYAQVSPRSVGGVSLFDAQAQISADTVAGFLSDDDTVKEATAQLTESGFEVLQATRMMINIAGSPSTYRKAFGIDLVTDERPVIKEGARKDTATFIEAAGTLLAGLINPQGTKFERSIEGIAIEEPRYFMAPSMFAPLKSYWHLRIPGDVSLADNADRAHRAGITGRGVKVAMVDSGWYKHPYFVGRGYSVAPVVLGPAAANPLVDEVGHGTGESANIFAVAPDVTLLPVKVNFVNSVGAFNAAVALQPDIITCSWGSHKPFGPLSAADQALAAAIAAAVASGIIVVFSAGNGHAGFPGQHPDVISAGGVFMKPDETLQASDYASGFMSTIYPNRRVPDLSGLVGMKPKAIYIMLPLEPKDQIDVGNAGGVHPNGDETTSSDGWAAFSGTSAAAPQLAGAAALVKQACPSLGPKVVRDILMKTARDVTTGKCNAVVPLHTGLPATVGPDTATGNGLVDAHKAAMLAKIKCLGGITPIKPIVGPILPITPVRPITPITPITPIRPIAPITPITPAPIQPIKPVAPVVLPAPTPVGGGQSSATSAQGGAALSAEEAASLEDMIIKGEIGSLEA